MAEEKEPIIGPVLSATMLGSVGVGKTTLLASMYQRFGAVIGDIQLDVRPHQQTALALQTVLRTLQRLPTEVKMSAALKGDAEVRRYYFYVGVPGQAPAFTLRFTDYSGQYFTREYYEHRDEVSQALVDSDVILVAIHAPALMEEGGHYNEAVNAVTQVTSEIKSLLSQGTGPKLLILTLLMSETYLVSAASTNDLLDRVRSTYRPLFDFLRQPAIRERIGCVVAAVKTVGPVRLNDVDTTFPDDPVFRFRATRFNAAYAPEDTDQPLRYLLRFIINKYRGDRHQRLGGLWAFWDRITGRDAMFEKALETFAAGCKDDGPVVVELDHDLLRVPDSR
jgi:hypothetical protein